MRSSSSLISRPWAAKAVRVKRMASVPYLLHNLQRIDDIAGRLGHLFAVFIPHQGMQIDVLEGYLVHEMQPHHHHPGDPEEEDVKAGD